MKKANMLTYLEQQLEKELKEYDFAIDWDTKNHTVEIIGVLYAHNQGAEAIADVLGVETEADVIEFEDSLLLYDPAKSILDDEADYLAIIPYEGKKGLSKGTIKMLASYLKTVLTDGQSNLMDFLENEDEEIFELRWDMAEFETLLASQTEPKEYVSYPKY